MRKIITILAGVAVTAIAPLPAFAHHKTTHSIGAASAREHAPAAPRAHAQARTLHFVTRQRGGSRARHQRASEAPIAAHEGEGVVAAVAGNEVTIRHEPVASLNWPAMTMSFQAQSPALLEGLAVGDHVRFRFQEAGTAHVIDQIVKQ